jgi:hypothetical protein
MVVDLATTLAAYAPLVRSRLPAGCAMRLAMTEGGQALGGVRLARDGAADGPVDGTLTLDRLAMARLLFGPVRPSTVADPPPSLRWLDQVLPLPFTVPGTFHA